MGIIDLKNVTKKYGEKIVLDKICFSAESGDFWAIEGQSGCGKSTFLNIVGLLEQPEQGEVIINSMCNPKPNSREWRRILKKEISYLFQNYGLIEGETVKTNLKIATRFLKIRRKDEKEIMNYALEKVGLHDILNRPIYQLSGGEQQRVAISKCIIKDTKIILADEPTGNVDFKNRDKIMELLSLLNQQGKTIILVTHDNEVAKCAKKRLQLQ